MPKKIFARVKAFLAFSFLALVVFFVSQKVFGLFLHADCLAQVHVMAEVVDGQTGRPISNARIYIFGCKPSEPHCDPTASDIAARSGEDGNVDVEVTYFADCSPRIFGKNEYENFGNSMYVMVTHKDYSSYSSSLKSSELVDTVRGPLRRAKLGQVKLIRK